ncbi:hypothetical protein LWI29_015096 [Acer saccharum]|uniref:Peptidase S8/S53 domain-containing protein n=1 Tax=Acer saccharum TaxID=4024 RepID=A0AA39SNK1_ACESA|nr:hypothetical protein LWI29_015096 [Acer saccharum]
MTSLYSFGQGTARGGVPSSRIAVYKVCWSDGCWEADTLAAFDDAIADGVDIISISIGRRHPLDYFNDSKAIGSFHAMRNGILTSFSAGNEGPKSYTISNIAPWFLSVAASTIDRNFSTKVQLGNNIFYEGISINTVDLTNTKYPLIYGGDAPNVTGGFSNNLSRFCIEDSLDRNLVKGKIVLCDRLVSGKGPFYAGAVGTVIQDTVRRDYARNFPLPTSYVNEADGRQILTYIKSNSNTSATIFKSTQGNDTKAPYVVSFSSRGPNPITLDILKPDITAPGVNILAAWTPLNSVSEVKGLYCLYGEQTKGTTFNIDPAHEHATSSCWQGISINTADLTNTMYPLIYGGDAPNVTGGFSNTSSRFCLGDSLNKNLVKGKIVLCDLLDTGEGPFYAGAAGAVIQDTTSRDYANNFPLPTSYVNNADGSNILNYIKSNSNASATIFKSTQGNDTKAPYVVSFSSRGPNPITLDILKGISINTVDLTNTTYPLIYGGDAPNVNGGFSHTLSRFCIGDSLDKNLVKGKIVLCDGLVSGRGPLYAGAVGTVIQDTIRRDNADNFPLPISYVNRADGSNILIYIKSNSNASATIFKSMQGNDTKAPYVVSFSSRGPNPITFDILKVRN